MQKNLGLITFLISCFLSCAQAPKREKIDTNQHAEKEEEQTANEKTIKIENTDSVTYYTLVTSFHSDSYGYVLVNGLPVVQKSKEEFEKAISKQRYITDFLVKGNNAIRLVGDLKNFDCRINKVTRRGSTSEETPIRILSQQENEFSFEILTVPEQYLGATEKITSQDFDELKDFVIKRDEIIKNKRFKSFMELQKTSLERMLNQSFYYPPEFTLKDIEKEYQQSFESLKNETKYQPIPFKKDDLQCFVSNSGNIATVRVKGTNYVSCFRNKETDLDWCFRSFYIKKEGKFIPMYL